MNFREFRQWSVWNLLGCLLLAGCSGGVSDAPPRAVVSGQVTFDGVPIETGMVRFVPSNNPDLPIATAMIENGAYLVDNKGGVPIGSHRVEVTGYRALSEARPSSELSDDVPQEQIIPEKYNQESELTLAIEQGTRTLTHDLHLMP